MEKWQAMHSLAKDRSTVTKTADKGLEVVVWDRKNNIFEAEKQFLETSHLKKKFYRVK